MLSLLRAVFFFWEGHATRQVVVTAFFGEVVRVGSRFLLLRNRD